MGHLLNIITMPLPKILKKASSYILGTQTGTSQQPFNDGEVVFCKNNVCVHPPALLRQDCDVVHHPGYLTITCQVTPDRSRTTLSLTWIPNTTLRKNPWAIERQESHIHRGDNDHDGCSLSSRSSNPKDDTNDEYPSISPIPENYRKSSAESIESQYSASDGSLQPVIQESASQKSDQYNKNLSSSNSERDSSHNSLSFEVQNCAKEDNVNSITVQHCEEAVPVDNLDTEHTLRPRLLPCEKEGDEPQEKDTQPSPSLSQASSCSLAVPLSFLGGTSDDIPTWMSSPELLALRHNLNFPESQTASPVVRRTHKCRRFSVDLSQMRSLRLFFNDTECTCGQLVVASRESQYKILHFHHGGLDRLAKVLQEWSFLLHADQPSAEDTLPYRHFMVCRPEVSEEELHPEEGHTAPISREVWESLLNELGQVEDDLALRKGIFFGGLEPEMRSTVWPFLLYCYSYQSTYEEREQIIAIRRQEYHEITRRRHEMDPVSQENFWRNIQCIVEKDVIRTDRGNPYFAGEENPNVEVMKNILLNYAVYNPGFGYTQGMSDLLAPVLAEIKNESDAFWCFVGLMQKAIFVCTPTDNDMDKNLNYLRELIRLMVPSFYNHLLRHSDAMELLFCHRWILLCFKREFPEAVALKMWEACWANYLTDYFHLFLCLAIISIYSDDVVAQDLRTDEMLLHFSSLAMFMNGELILRKARGLLYQFREMQRIPCTVAGLCQLCGPGMWDSTHAPVVECTRNHLPGQSCPHRT